MSNGNFEKSIKKEPGFRSSIIRKLAEFMHDEYEKAAGALGWDTQESCKVEFEALPQKNKDTMMYVAEKVYDQYIESESEKSPMMSECWLVHPIDDIDCERCPQVGECREVRAEIDRLTEENKEAKEFIDGLYKEEPSLKKEGLNSFDGYYVHWNVIIKICEGAWPEKDKVFYECSPAELIVEIINERDEFKEQLKAKNEEIWRLKRERR